MPSCSPPAVRPSRPPDRSPSRSSERSARTTTLLVALAAALAAIGVATVGGVAAADAENVRNPATDAASTATSDPAAAVAQSEETLDANVSLAPTPAEPGRVVRFDASASTGPIETYDWGIGGEPSFRGLGLGEHQRYVFEQPGTYTVVLRVHDPDGYTDVARQNLTVEPADLEARLRVRDDDVVVGEPFFVGTLNTTGNVTDAGLDLDGGETLYDLASLPENASVDPAYGNGTFGRIHTYREPGVRVIEHWARNASNATDHDRKPVTVRPERNDARLDARLNASEVTDEHAVGPTDRFRLNASASLGDVDEYWWFLDGRFVRQTDGAETEVFYEGNESTNVTLIAAGPVATDRANATLVPSSPEYEPPDVVLDVGNERTHVGEHVYMNALDTTGDVARYVWRVDGEVVETSSALTYQHAFDEPGNYTVALTAVGRGGTNDTATTTVRVDEALAPKLSIDPPNPKQGHYVTFDVGNTTGDVERYEWRVDGEWALETSAQHDRTFVEAGTHWVSLTAHGEHGQTNVTEWSIDVQPAPLEASLDVLDEAPAPGEVVRFDLSGSTGPIETMRFRPHDGATPHTMQSGRLYIAEYGSPGTYTAELTVVGVDGSTDTATVDVTVANENSGGSDGGGGSVSLPVRSASDGEPTFEIRSVDAPEEVDAGETFQATIRVENHGGSGDGDLTVDLHGQAQERLDVAADGDETDAVTTSIGTPTAGGEYDLLAQTASDAQRVPISVSDAGSGQGGAGNETGGAGASSSDGDDRVSDRSSDGTDGSGDDATPGFAAVAALLALTSGALALRRRA